MGVRAGSGPIASLPPGALLSLWLRVYALVFVCYQALGLIFLVAWMVRAAARGSGYGVASLAGTYLLLVVPAGFGITLALSIPLAAMWYVAARVMHWPLAPPRVRPRERCRRCGYELTGLDAPRCPECGYARNAGSPALPDPDHAPERPTA